MRWVDVCYRLIHRVHAVGWTVLHSSYQTLASCISVRVKALSHLAPPPLSRLSTTDYCWSLSLLTTRKNVSLHWIGHLVSEVQAYLYECFVCNYFSHFFSNFYVVKSIFLLFLSFLKQTEKSFELDCHAVHSLFPLVSCSINMLPGLVIKSITKYKKENMDKLSLNINLQAHINSFFASKRQKGWGFANFAWVS